MAPTPSLLARAVGLLLLLLLATAAAGDVRRNEGIAAHLGICPSGMCIHLDTGLCFRITSYECGPPRPTPRPTPKPTFGTVMTSHGVAIVVRGLPRDTALSPEVRAHMLRDVRDRLESGLNGKLDFVNVEFSGHLPRPDGDRTSASLPLNIQVQVRADLNDVALASIMDVLRDLLQDLSVDLKALDYDLFRKATLDVDTFDFGEILSATARPTPRPTPNPTMPTRVTSSHRVRVTLDGMPRGYKLTSNAWGAILRTVRGVIKDNLGNGLKLVNVAFAGRLRSQVSGRVSLPLRVTLRGDKDVSDFALSVLLDVLSTEGNTIANELKALEWGAFKGATVSTGTYDELDIDVTPEAPVVLEKSEHPIALTVGNVAVGYRLSPNDKVRLTRFVQGLLEDNLDDSLELVAVDYAGTRRLASEGAPPSDALGHILETLNDHKLDIVQFLQTLDADALDAATVYVGRFDPSAGVNINTNVLISGLEETEHAVQLVFKNLPAGYRLSSSDRFSLIRFVERLLADNLDQGPLELLDVAYAGKRRALQAVSQRTRRLDELSLPLHITVRGPHNAQKYALSDLLQVLEAHEEDLMRFLVSLDRNAFQDAVVNFEWDARFGLEESRHSLWLKLRDVPTGYRLTNRDLSNIVRFVREVLADNLHPSLELIDVAYGAMSGGRRLGTHRKKSEELDAIRESGTQRRGALVVPLVVTVRGPEDEVDPALARIMRAIRGSVGEIELYLKSIDGVAFQNSEVEIEASDPANQAVIMSEGEESGGQSWWVWFLVAVSILVLLCICCICMGWCWKYYQEASRDDEKNLDVYLSGRHDVKEDKPRKRRGRKSSREVQPIVIVERPVLMGPSAIPYDPNAVPSSTMVSYAPHAPPPSPFPALEAAEPERLALPYYEQGSGHLNEFSVASTYSFLSGRGMEPLDRLDQSEPEGFTCNELEAEEEEVRRSKRRKKKKKRHRERKADGPFDIDSINSDEDPASILTKEPEVPRPHSNRGGLFASLHPLVAGGSSEEEILDSR